MGEQKNTNLGLSLIRVWMSFFLTANRYETSDGGWLTTRLGRPSGMGYQGISLFVMAFGAVMFFHYLPLDHVSGVVGKAVDWVSRYCMGIYCSHLLVGYVLYAWVFPHVGVGLETFWACIWIWLASWLCCALIALIPGKFSKMLVQ